MSSELLSHLDYVSGYRDKRVLASEFVLNHPAHFEELLQLCFETEDEKSYKASWVLEQVVYSKLDWLQPHLDFFCSTINKLNNESAIRPVAKVLQLLVENHFKKRTIQLTQKHLELITECCFDWLTSDTKVAAKCYCIRTLFVLGKSNDWIYPELQIIVEKDYPSQSAAYKAVSGEILKKIK
jgi:hypothetical protein